LIISWIYEFYLYIRKQKKILFLILSQLNINYDIMQIVPKKSSSFFYLNVILIAGVCALSNTNIFNKLKSQNPKRNIYDLFSSLYLIKKKYIRL
jgi:hypothetical protein